MLGENIPLCSNVVLTSFLFKKVDRYSHRGKMKKNLSSSKTSRKHKFWIFSSSAATVANKRRATAVDEENCSSGWGGGMGRKGVQL